MSEFNYFFISQLLWYWIRGLLLNSYWEKLFTRRNIFRIHALFPMSSSSPALQEEQGNFCYLSLQLFCLHQEKKSMQAVWDLSDHPRSETFKVTVCISVLYYMKTRITSGRCLSYLSMCILDFLNCFIYCHLLLPSETIHRYLIRSIHHRSSTNSAVALAAKSTPAANVLSKISTHMMSSTLL